MTTYLTIITTLLVLTQIIRVTQNAIQIHRQNVLFKKQCAELVDVEIRKEDFALQRKAYALIVEYLEKKSIPLREMNFEVTDCEIKLQ